MIQDLKKGILEMVDTLGKMVKSDFESNFKISIVQPSVSKSKITDSIK